MIISKSICAAANMPSVFIEGHGKKWPYEFALSVKQLLRILSIMLNVFNDTHGNFF